MTGENNPFYGKTHTKESNNKNRINHLKENITDERIKIISEAAQKRVIEYPITKETRKIKSEFMIDYWENNPDRKIEHSKLMTGENNPFYGKTHTKESRKKMSDSTMEYIKTMKGVYTDTKPELKFKEWLSIKSIVYIHQYRTEYGMIDFYLPEQDLYIEIDGSNWWHPLEKMNLSFHQLSGFIGECKKLNIGNKLIRIRPNTLLKLNEKTTIDELKSFNESPNLNITYFQKMFNKEYIREYVKSVEQKVLLNRSRQLLSLIKLIQPEFPTIPSTENLQTTISKLSKYDIIGKQIYDNTTHIFRNNCHHLGISYLKSNFRSYWKSSYNKNLSPVEA